MTASLQNSTRKQDAGIIGSANRKPRAGNQPVDLADLKPSLLACAASVTDFRQRSRRVA
jgi:hypothetical protein